MRKRVGRSRQGAVVALAVFGVGTIVPVLSTVPAWAAPAKGEKNGAATRVAKDAEESRDPFTRGMEQYRAGKLEDALASFKQAETKDPKDGIIQSWLGFVLTRLNMNQEAVEHLNKALELSSDKNSPSNADTYNNLGNAYLALGETDKAIEAYQKAVDLIKDQTDKRADPYYNLGNAQVKRGNLEAALEAFLQAEKQDPNDPLTQNNLGFVYEQLNAQDATKYPIIQAVDHYSKAATAQPNNPVFQRNLGLALRKRDGIGKSEDGIKALKRAIELNPKDYNSHLALAEDYQTKGDIPAAINEYKICVALAPNEFVPRYNLGLLYARGNNQANYKEAIAQLEDASKQKPKDTRPLTALGWVNYKANRLEDAAKWYEQALAIDPNLQPAHANLGLVYQQLGKYDLALQHWKEALRLEPNDVAARTLLASELLRRQQWDEAIAEYRKVLEARPEDAGAHNNLGYALEKLGKLNEAAAEYQKAIESSASAPPAPVIIPGTSPNAPAYPIAAVAHNNLGAIYHRQGKNELARQHYLKALEIAPNFPDAKRNLQRLQMK